MKVNNLVELFYLTLKKDGRKLIWFKKNYLPKIRYEYISYQLNGWKKSGIDPDITSAMNKYMSDFEERTNGKTA